MPLADYVDGGWWPRSRQLPVELPGLLADLSGRLDRVALVGYHRDAWDVTPDEVEINGAQVRLQGFSSNDPPTLVVIGNEGHHITLLVVPPDTTDTLAQQALVSASGPAGDAAETTTGEPVSPSEQHALTDVAGRLTRLPGNTGPDRAALISRWVEEAAAQFSSAPIQAFVPILVEHIVRGRLHTTGATR